MKSVTGSLILVFALNFLFSGCSFFSHYQREQKEALELKKRNYAALYNALNSARLKKGLLTSDIEKQFGKPDNVFQSGSTSGGFSVWTYEKVLDQNLPEKWQLIRLYFDKEKLVDWKY